jgi:hypothetical protein
LSWLRKEYFESSPHEGKHVLAADLEGEVAAVLYQHAIDWANQRMFFGPLFTPLGETMMSAILDAFVASVVDRMPLRALHCQCLPDTRVMEALMRARFEPMVRRRSHTYVRGRFQDVVLMVLRIPDPGLNT